MCMQKVPLRENEAVVTKYTQKLLESQLVFITYEGR